MRELWQKIFYTSSAQIYSLMIQMLTLTITARWLGPEGRGLIAAVTTWVGLFSTFGHFSLSAVAIHKATNKQNQAWFEPTLGSLLFLAVIITLVGWTGATTLYVFTDSQFFNHLPISVLLIGFSTLPLLIWDEYSTSLLIAIDRLKTCNISLILNKTLTLALILGILFHKGQIYEVMIATAFSQLVQVFVKTWDLFRHAVVPVIPDRQTIFDLLKGGCKLHLNSVGTFIFTSTDILMINHYRGVEETGYYQLAFQLINVMLIIPKSASTVLYSKTAQLGADRVWPYQRKLLVMLLLIIIFFSTMAALISPFLIPFLFGKNFSESVGIFQLLLLGLIGMTFSTIMASQWIGRGMFWQASAITITVGVLNFIANIFLIPKYGMYGGVWATLGSYSLSIISNGCLGIVLNLHFKNNQDDREKYKNITL